MAEVIRHRGAMTVLTDDTIQTLPLPVAGLMADLSYEAVCEDACRVVQDDGRYGFNTKPLYVPLVSRAHGHPLRNPDDFLAVSLMW